RGPPTSSDGGGAELTEPNAEHRVEERRRRDERHVGALAEQMIRALDRGHAADAENRTIPGARLPPREHLFDLPCRERPRIRPDDRRASAARTFEGGVAVLLDDAATHAVRHHEAVRP